MSADLEKRLLSRPQVGPRFVERWAKERREVLVVISDLRHRLTKATDQINGLKARNKSQKAKIRSLNKKITKLLSEEAAS